MQSRELFIRVTIRPFRKGLLLLFEGLDLVHVLVERVVVQDHEALFRVLVATERQHSELTCVPHLYHVYLLSVRF